MMSKLPKPKEPVGKKKKIAGNQFPENLLVGEVLKDTAAQEWILGPSIGKGGFGVIYSAEKNGSISKTNPYAVKIEPHENGPLFVEKNFYIKVMKKEDVAAWKKSNNIKFLSLPEYYGSGTHLYSNKKYRFLVMERYGKDLWSIFLDNKRTFPPHSVFKCAMQIIDVLNYIHDKDYIHGDIKGTNLLFGLKNGTQDNIFLVDFGLACKYSTKEFKKDPKRAHNGTIEYTSCDWHLGVPTRRGDMEILGYNLLQWLNQKLPWEQNIKNKDKVYEKKKELMTNVNEYFPKHFPNIPKVIRQYFEYVSNLKYDESPNYKYCKELFLRELKKLKIPISGKLELKNTPIKHVLKDVNFKSDEEEEVPIKKKKTSIRMGNHTPSPTSEKRRKKLMKTSVSPQLTPKNNQSSESEEKFFTPDEIKDDINSSKDYNKKLRSSKNKKKLNLS